LWKLDIKVEIKISNLESHQLHSECIQECSNDTDCLVLVPWMYESTLCTAKLNYKYYMYQRKQECYKLQNRPHSTNTSMIINIQESVICTKWNHQSSNSSIVLAYFDLFYYKIHIGKSILYHQDFLDLWWEVTLVWLCFALCNN